MFFTERHVPKDFSRPTDLPSDDAQRDRWQEANRSWWESFPMRYDWYGTNPAEESSKEYYEEVDRRFYACVRKFMPWNEIPFDPLVDFAALADQDVLEIGVGNGSHAQLLSSRADSYTGIDLTDNAVNATTQRLSCFGIDANITRMDAERLDFPDNSFDLVWSWGVIHHSADTRRILSEIARVLRPGGRCITMVYHRSFWFYYIYRGLIPGLFKFKFFRGMSLTQVVESGTDGAIARFYTIPDWKKLVSEFMDVERVEIYGQQDELLPLPGGEFKERICDAIPTSIAKSFLTRFKQGSFLVSIQRKRG